MLEDRRFPRITCVGGLMSLSWVHQGLRNHIWGRSLDVSEQGVGVQLPRYIPVGTPVTVRAGWLELEATATVKGSSRYKGKYRLGLEFQELLQPEIWQRIVASQHRLRSPLFGAGQALDSADDCAAYKCLF